MNSKGFLITGDRNSWDGWIPTTPILRQHWWPFNGSLWRTLRPAGFSWVKPNPCYVVTWKVLLKLYWLWITLIPFLGGWTSIYQLFWCEQKGYKVLTHCHIIYLVLLWFEVKKDLFLVLCFSLITWFDDVWGWLPDIALKKNLLDHVSNNRLQCEYDLYVELRHIRCTCIYIYIYLYIYICISRFLQKKSTQGWLLGWLAYIYIHMIPVPGPVAPPNGMVPYFLT